MVMGNVFAFAMTAGGGAWRGGWDSGSRLLSWKPWFVMSRWLRNDEWSSKETKEMESQTKRAGGGDMYYAFMTRSESANREGFTAHEPECGKQAPSSQLPALPVPGQPALRVRQDPPIYICNLCMHTARFELAAAPGPPSGILSLQKSSEPESRSSAAPPARRPLMGCSAGEFDGNTRTG